MAVPVSVTLRTGAVHGDAHRGSYRTSFVSHLFRMFPHCMSLPRLAGGRSGSPAASQPAAMPALQVSTRQNRSPLLMLTRRCAQSGQPCLRQLQCRHTPRLGAAELPVTRVRSIEELPRHASWKRHACGSACRGFHAARLRVRGASAARRAVPHNGAAAGAVAEPAAWPR